MEIKTLAAHRAAEVLPRRGGVRETEAGVPPVRVLSVRAGGGRAGAKLAATREEDPGQD